ncbi:hypothetical protein NC653_019789 [Populus alba x Populus x berolinensis]|uniref:Uncharacterized protein n=1 Tax=Populus alba x Populus x berolinensis TaxID=444605 RepID=A0AAD6QJW5_9ROSI|nr:hypothetical protein NC653_019789 [Populus alba x Populus x berolinensis]
MDPSVLNNFTFLEPYVPPEFSEYNRQAFDVLAQTVQLWLHQSLRYTHNLINCFRGVHILGPFQYANLTVLLEDGIVDSQFVLDQSILGLKVKYEEKVLESIKGAEVNINLSDEEDQPSAVDENSEVIVDKSEWDFIVLRILKSLSIKGAEVNINLSDEEDQPSAVDENIEVVGEKNDWDFNSAPDSEEFSVPESEEANLRPGSGVTELVSQHKKSSKKVLKLPPTLWSSKVTWSLKTVCSDPTSCRNSTRNLEFHSSQGINDISSAGIESPASEVLQQKILRGSELVNTRSAQIMVGISLIVFSLLGTAFIYMKSQTPTTRNAASAVDQMLATKKLDDSPMPVAAEHTDIESPMPSETSSFSLSYRKKGQGGTSEAHSCERKPRKNIYRREFMASPDYSVGSMGSPSYGSFTTYEKIPSKHGNEDEEVITPVSALAELETKSLLREETSLRARDQIR